MSFFQKRSVATLIAVILVLVSTTMSVNVKFGTQVRQVTDSFYSATSTETYNQKSISSHLNNLCAYTDGLVTIANNYDIDTEDAEWASRSLKLAMSYSREEISYIYSCYSDLTMQADKLVDQLYRAELNERDASGLTQYESSIEEAKSAIESAAGSYNDTVREFRLKYDHFPTDSLAEMADVEMPEYFAYG